MDFSYKTANNEIRKVEIGQDHIVEYPETDVSDKRQLLRKCERDDGK